jgi:transcriptional regulator with XRE-family HTH domain
MEWQPIAWMCAMKAKEQNPTLRAVGETIRTLRHKRRLSIEALAGMAGLHRNYLGEVERARRNVSIVNLVKIARALGVAPAKLLAKL